MKNRKGFTLLEILLVVAALAILAGIVILAINPTKQLGETRDAQRRSDVNAVLNAVYQYSIDHDGSFPSDIVAGGTCATDFICRTDTGDSVADNTACGALVYLGELTPDYLTALPEDPQLLSTATNIGYGISQSGNRITVCAPSAEQLDAGEEISVTR